MCPRSGDMDGAPISHHQAGVGERTGDLWASPAHHVGSTRSLLRSRPSPLPENSVVRRVSISLISP